MSRRSTIAVNSDSQLGSTAISLAGYKYDDDSDSADGTAQQSELKITSHGLQVEGGRMLSENAPLLTVVEAEDAARRHRVVTHGYRRPVEDITTDRERVEQELQDLQPQPRIGGTVATLYSDDNDTVLALERFR